MIARTAVLGWGSLIWQPTNRHGAVVLAGPWHRDGPKLPVEFARISADGRLTLVILPEYRHRSPVLWAPSGFATVDATIANLARRETRAPHSAIHGVTAAGRVLGRVAPTVAGRVRRWLAGRQLDAAVWTGLPPGEQWGSAGFSGQAAVEYAAGLEGNALRRATEYVRRAPAQMTTPLRPRLEAALGGARPSHR